jgi:glutamate 5-kinase
MLKGEEENDRSKRLAAAHRVVIKLGTSIVSGADGELCRAQVEPIVRSIVLLKRSGRQVVLVSSGAVGLGAGRLGLPRARLSSLVVRQACAAVGQNLLMNAYEQLFGAHDVRIAQVLLTEEDFADRHRYRNLQSTMEKLLKLGVLPIVNENDTVSTAELEYLSEHNTRIFGDNDRLAALVMSKLEADALVLLTDVDGLQSRKSERRKHEKRASASSRNDEEAELIPLVQEITQELRALASGPSAGGRGGMLSKIDAAQIAMQSGGIAVVANGKIPNTLDRIFAGEQVGTLFVSSSRMHGKRRWIAYAASVRGRVIVNAGAREAILRGKASLLASGVIRVEGDFDSLDVVSIAGPEGREFARGLANWASTKAAVLINDRNEEPAGGREGQPRASVLVTRDNIVILETTERG